MKRSGLRNDVRPLIEWTNHEIKGKKNFTGQIRVELQVKDGEIIKARKSIEDRLLT